MEKKRFPDSDFREVTGVRLNSAASEMAWPGGVPEEVWRLSIAFLDGVDGGRVAAVSKGVGTFVDEAFWRGCCEALGLTLPVREPAKAAFPTFVACAELESVRWDVVRANLPRTEGVPVLAVDQGRLYVFGGWGGVARLMRADVSEIESGRLRFVAHANSPVPTYNGAVSDIGDGVLVYSGGFEAGGYHLESTYWCVVRLRGTTQEEIWQHPAPPSGASRPR